MGYNAPEILTSGAVAVFATPEGLEPGREHRFHLEVPLEVWATGMVGTNPTAGTFVFDFEVPVLPVPVVEVGQKTTVEGVTLTLERVVNSPGRPQAIVCIEPPDGEHAWTPWLVSNGLPVDAATALLRLEDGCWSLTMGAPVEGRSSVTVAYLDGFPKDVQGEGPVRPKKITGPWRFEFKVPNP